MSWWVYLVSDEEKFNSEDEDYDSVICEVQAHTEGGTYVMGGIDRAELNVTYNYSRHFRGALGGEGLSDLNGAQASEVLELLRQAAAELGIERDDDYWASTEGNAGHALSILASWAKANPDAIFVVS